MKLTPILKIILLLLLCVTVAVVAFTAFFTMRDKVKLNIEPDAKLALKSFSGTSVGQPMDKTQVNSDYFRIPAMITLDNGWIVAAADSRWRTSSDSPNNLDTIVSISKDGGKNWEWETVNYYSDYPSDVNSNKSSSFIDPALLKDGEGNVWMAVDSLGANCGLMHGNNLGRKSTGFDEKGRIIIAKAKPGSLSPKSASAYTYYLDLNSNGIDTQIRSDEPIVNAWNETVTVYPICREQDDFETDYYADAFFNTYEKSEDGKIVPIYCAQQSSTFFTQDNLYYCTSIWRTYPTFFIMLRKGTVTSEGIKWGDPIYPNIKSNPKEAFTAVCPGRGFVTTLAGGNERIIFPMYDNDNGTEYTSIIYSDDGGKTWTRGSDADALNGTGKSSESQIISLPDGNLRMYSRNTADYISYADSTDNGETWDEYTFDTALPYCGNCMVSFINIDGTIVDNDGNRYTNLVMASYPMNLKNKDRYDGTVRIGYINENEAGMPIHWFTAAGEPRYSGQFRYSCLTQMLDENGEPTNKFAILYEPNDEAGRISVLFDTFSIQDIIGNRYTFEK